MRRAAPHGSVAVHAPPRPAATRQDAATSGGASERLLGALAAGLSSLLVLTAPAVAKPNVLLDVPTCSNFKASDSGIKFCDVKLGSGESPLPGDLVLVDYTARALAAGGKAFDGSASFKFFVGGDEVQVVQGFDLAILGDGYQMPPVKEGGVRTVVLPPSLAFGEKGDGCLYGLEGSCRIPPNSEVEIAFRYLGLGYGR